MLFVDNQNETDPRANLALEEHLLRNVQIDDPLLLFYINAPSVIIGRNQNTLSEIDPDYVRDHQVHVVRRLSGGGAVYHDLGNLNFSFITNGRHDLHNFAAFTAPVIDVLKSLGVPAELRGHSDIFAAGKKISGNAQYATPTRMFSHGTLLFDTDIAAMLHALNPRQMTIETKAVQSVRNYVVNISELLTVHMDIHAFREALLTGIFGAGDPPAYTLSAAEWAQVAALRRERYNTWDWNIGRAPKFNVQRADRLPVGKMEARIDVEKGRIQAVRIYGDFSGERPIRDLEARLIGLRYDREALLAALADVDVTTFLGPLPTVDFVGFLCD